MEGCFSQVGDWHEEAPATGNEGRQTEALFQPPMKRVWNEPRFASLFQRIGLEDYWLRSGTLLDFRRP